MSLIPFPNVPDVAGVPAVLRSATVPTPGALLNMAVSEALALIFGTPIWGIYDKDGQAVLVGDSVVGIDYKNGGRVAMHPLESGQFESYNKVQTPYDCRVKMAIGGDLSSRSSFLSECDFVLKSTDLYSVVTPEITYTNCTLQNYDYRRESRGGVSLLVVDLWFIEVRQSKSTLSGDQAQADTAKPEGSDKVSSGQVQAYNPKTGQDVGKPL